MVDGVVVDFDGGVVGGFLVGYELILVIIEIGDVDF